MINKDGLASLLRDLRVLDFLKSKIGFEISENTLSLYSYYERDGECKWLMLDIPDYIKDDVYDFVVDMKYGE